jgi:hypothetical protein
LVEDKPSAEKKRKRKEVILLKISVCIRVIRGKELSEELKREKEPDWLTKEICVNLCNPWQRLGFTPKKH